MDDLNLSTKLEYALQPINRETVDLVEISRQAMSEVLNSELPEHAPVQGRMTALEWMPPGWWH